ncbi:MAG: aminotransferase class V-fold PLP-dependent enzyme [Nitrosopumilaceae archaeon]|nr:cysteine desulfurase [Nitrosopumilaceae archaeon]NIU00523.1 cysteine desulfurase [Nitrosopumilaceae archaeon]NIU86906.1 aminotransferase class V-fold PLP-dependent enzyme [Nitrosopumilaceae archaeon]NIV65586.1 aminotransferase class V-fold PLP-dependent enzyme [Nitrosopumilaceae archaeon]NIX61125.1 aminotransferase class V-fold PLP-dependent enzyme [Nitrosopumilaceae archaeon]
MIYLDNAASTKLHSEVINDMMPFLKELYGNPSSIHRFGRIANKAVQKSRRQVAALINANPSKIFFTSGGTESNNTAILGFARSHRNGNIITSKIEHDAVLEPCKYLEKLGYSVKYIPVDKFGLVDLAELEREADSNSLVSIMFANNEVGTIQPIDKISKICKEKGALFHSDAVQAIGKVPIDLKQLDIDFLSISSHKINGPKGIGALYVREIEVLDPLVFGGGQENGMRSGTENVANIVGFGKACELAKQNLSQNISCLRNLRDILTSKVIENISNSRLNGHPEQRLPNNAHFTFLGINGEDLIIKLDENEIAASTGSACSVRTQKASHVLQSMGFTHEEITGSLRLSIGIDNSEDEILTTLDTLASVVSELRSVSPYKEKYQFLSKET